MSFGNPNNKSTSSILQSNAMNVVGIDHYNPNAELDGDYERRDIHWAHETNPIEQLRKGNDPHSKLALAGSKTLQDDVNAMQQAKREQGMIHRLKKEYVRELDNYKSDLFKRENIYISPDVGVSLVDNPFLIDGMNEDQLKELHPSKVEERMLDLQEKEEALAHVISKLPVNDELYGNMLAVLEVIAKDRALAEKEYLEFKLREDPDFAMPQGAFGKRRERVRKRLLKALDFGEKGEQIKYNKYDGFYLWLDHIVNVHRNFRLTMLDFKIIDATGTPHSTLQTTRGPLVLDVKRYRRSFASRHRIYNIHPHDYTYILFKFHVTEKFEIFDYEPFRDPLKVEESKLKEGVFEEKEVIYGWCPFKLFHGDKLRVGRWKLPLFKTPLPENIDFEQLRAYSYLKFGTLFIRLALYEERIEKEEVLPADMALRGYQMTGYLQEHDLEPELDEWLGIKDKEKDRYQREKELAFHRKNLMMKLLDRKDKVKDEFLRIKEDERQDKLDKMKKAHEKDMKKTRKKLLKEQKKLDKAFRKLEKDRLRAEAKKRERLENRKRISEKRWGIKITLKKATGFRTFDTVRLVYGLFVDNNPMYDDLGDILQYSSKPYKSKVIKKGNKKAPKRVVIFKDNFELFVKNCEGLVLLNKGVRKVYLGFKLLYFERIRRRRKKKVLEEGEQVDPLADLALPKKATPRLAGWFFWEIGTNKGKLKSSGKKVQINLYKPPLLRIPFKKQGLKGKESKMKISFICEKFFYEMASLPFFAEMRIKKRQKALKNKKVILETFEKDFKKQAFIPNEERQWKNQSFSKGSGIDIYIDGIRFLPDNTTTTKILVKIVDSQLNGLIYPQAGLPVLESDMFNPRFEFRQELRMPNYDPTLMIFITYITLDARGTSAYPEILGYSFLNLFVNKYKDRQPVSRAEKPDSVLNTGFHQIPIFCQKYKKSKDEPFFVSSCYKYDKLPGSSTLVRIRLAPRDPLGIRVLGLRDEKPKDREKYGIWVRPPEYKTGAYNNRLCKVGQTETELINSRTRRIPVPCRESAKDLMRFYDMPLNENEGTKKDREDAIIEFLDDNMFITEKTGFLNLKYFSRYSSNRGGAKGFKMSIDGLHNLPTPKYYFCLYTVNPEASFYIGEKSKHKLKSNTSYDWDVSGYTTIIYNENYVRYADVPYHPNAHFVVDVRSIRMTSDGIPEFKKEAWTIIPIFTPDEYVNSGIYQFPLFKGAPDPGMLRDMSKTDCWQYMMKALELKGNAGIQYWGKASVFCRLLDLQREGHFQNKFDYERRTTEYLPEEDLNKYLFTEDSKKYLVKQPLLQKLDPYGENVTTFNKKLSDAVSREFQLGDLDDDSEDSFEDDDYRFGENENQFFNDNELFVEDDDDSLLDF